MPDQNCSSLSPSPTQFITETVQAVLKEVEKGRPFSPSLFTTPQAARYLNTSASFLASLRAKGKGPPYIQIESAIRFLRSDIDAWLSQQVIQPANDSQSFVTLQQFAPPKRTTPED